MSAEAAVAVAKAPIDSLESAVSASRYAVPRSFLRLADVLVLTAAFLIGWRLAPLLQSLLTAETAAPYPWLSWLSLPPARSAAGLRPLGEVAWVPAVMIPVTLLFMQMAGGYRPLLEQSRTRVLLTSLLSPVAGLSVVSLALVAVRHQHTSRALIFSATLVTALGFLGCRHLVRLYKRRRLAAGHYARNVVLLAPPEARRFLAAHFAMNVSPSFYRLSGYLETEEAGFCAEKKPSECARLGRVEDLGDLVVHRPIHDVVVVQANGAERWLPKVMETCEYFRITLRLVPQALLSWNSRNLQASSTRDPLGLPQIVLRPRYLDDDALFAKRVFDIVGAAILLVALSPLLAFVALAIKLTTPGLPVLYAWPGVGYKGRTFTGYKFTTMEAHAAERKAELEHLNEMTGPVFKIKHDPRITPLGRWLRKYSVDELPQLWNVLRGDMSLVGPRPAIPGELARYELWHKRKLTVQPGMTCLWQVRGRNKIRNFDDWVRMDFEYIDNWSLWLDCVILLRTVRAVLAGTGS